ncbi:MAG: hypothetical protein VX069_07355 [Cyanobacteriota bacterium]|uniref:hypothetical protein n=1 Tax=Synechococcus sp. KORDI-100 TaxID=1280380 RepID=UPI0004E05FB2|nr:hypothetical protein [Synechococcus sp. KORDI-100]AII43564.1 hypothetical protein KR100_09350 [Synechococcus sp. KORDI-100]MEC8214869.1 hypothetical protein [Cyanobacteriota bacterium]MED5384063.1 hypothetical protein [Cyanobacteriota bacterium]
MGQHHEAAPATLVTLITGAVIGAGSLAWWLLNEADRRRRLGHQQAMLYAPRMQDGSEVLDPVSNGHKRNQALEERVERLNAAIADVRRQLEGLGKGD